MTALSLVRHGQASLGEEDYDQLSTLGIAQCKRLGMYWREHGQQFSIAYAGTLRRHSQSLASILEGMGTELSTELLPELNEYDSFALIQCIDDKCTRFPRTLSERQAHFKLLFKALEAWVNSEISPSGMPTWNEFSERIQVALERIRTRHLGEHVLLVSSAGPISTAVAHIMGSSPDTVIRLNMRLQNSAVSELGFTKRRYSMQSFNTLPHLSTKADGHLVTSV